ncbi:hypothetical protein M378DRAFT_172928 [Amanita muscaria Koide BX008]|uniref:Squalene monooxygenase n=1 Tax=Amanita muscaria (strain Koide BX008) TaxID=946122 RepID=A0A0C2S0L4_AMAMK|nr:hypothetical protein M378DRAFT_172928 [Amanita muscaria Koide BX008]
MMNQDDSHTHYDVLIVGAGIAGSALAHALSTLHRPTGAQLCIALLERSLAEPNRIVGELLQPGGVMALRQLGPTMIGTLGDFVYGSVSHRRLTQKLEM